MKLRDYQINAIENIRVEFIKGNNKIVLCAPTGSGKTIIFSELTRLTNNKGKTVLIITNRKELLSQTDNKLSQFGIKPDLLNAKQKGVTVGSIVVAMVETLNRRLTKNGYENFIQSFDLIIIDECHINCFNKIFENIKPKQKVIGCSATPQRKNTSPALEKYYNSIINVCQVQELIDLNFLSDPISFGIPINLKGVKTKGNDYDDKDLEKLYDDKIKYTGAIKNYEMHALNKKTIVFCASIKNSKTLSQEFILAGYDSKHFDCYMSDNDRNEVLTWFYNTKTAILCNVGILTTGFDCPDIKCILLYRATKSLSLFLQMVGRGSRIAENKNNFIILDFGNNIKTHGFWETDRFWNLENPKKTKKLDVAPVKECPECGALVPINIKKCKAIIRTEIWNNGNEFNILCGYEWPLKEEQKKEKEIILQQYIRQKHNTNKLSTKQLEEARVAHGYKVGWVFHKLNTLKQFEEYEQIRGYKRGWARYAYDRYRGQNNEPVS